MLRKPNTDNKKINLLWFLHFAPGTLTAIWLGYNLTVHLLLIKLCVT